MSLRGLESVRVLSKTPKLETMPMFGRAKTGFGRLARVRLASLVLTHTNRLTRTTHTTGNHRGEGGYHGVGGGEGGPSSAAPYMRWLLVDRIWICELMEKLAGQGRRLAKTRVGDVALRRW